MIIRVLDKSGDTVVDVEQDVDLAETLFAEAIASGKMAYAKAPGGNYHIGNLNKARELGAAEVVLQPNYVGG